MKAWITLIIIPIYIGIFVNIITAKENAAPSHFSKIFVYKDLALRHINALKNEYGKKTEIHKRCDEITAIADRIYQWYLENQIPKNNITHALYNIQNDCIKIVNPDINLNEYNEGVEELKRNMNAFYNLIINRYTHKQKFNILSIDGSVALLLGNIILFMPIYVLCVYIGILGDGYIEFLAMITVIGIFWVIEIIVIALGYIIKKLWEGKKQ